MVACPAPLRVAASPSRHAACISDDALGGLRGVHDRPEEEAVGIQGRAEDVEFALEIGVFTVGASVIELDRFPRRLDLLEEIQPSRRQRLPGTLDPLNAVKVVDPQQGRQVAHGARTVQVVERKIPDGKRPGAFGAPFVPECALLNIATTPSPFASRSSPVTRRRSQTESVAQKL